jgi:hypothetical protein
MGASAVKFTNATGSTVYVAYMRREANRCGARCGSNWAVLGWIKLEPGASQSRANPDKNRWFYYYAESADGSMVWNGAYQGEAQRQEFSECRGCIPWQMVHHPKPRYFPSPPWYELGYRELDTNSFGGVNLTP